MSNPLANHPDAVDGREGFVLGTPLHLKDVSLMFLSMSMFAHFVSTEVLIFSHVPAYPGSFQGLLWE